MQLGIAASIQMRGAAPAKTQTERQLIASHERTQKPAATRFCVAIGNSQTDWSFPSRE